jgi:hypothetical protein
VHVPLILLPYTSRKILLMQNFAELLATALEEISIFALSPCGDDTNIDRSAVSCFIFSWC